MNAILQLMLSYFTRTPGLRWMAAGGVVAFIACVIALQFIQPNIVTDTIMFFAPLTLLVGAGLMPMMVAQLAHSRTLGMLPHGRWQLFLSALITVVLVSFPLPFLGALAQIVQVPKSVAAQFTLWQAIKTGTYLFWSFYMTTFLVATWLYVAIGFATSQRTLAGLTKCLLVIIALIYVPSQRIVQLDPKFQITAWEALVSWVAIGVWIARARPARGGGALANIWRRFHRSYAAGHEFEWLLGTARPGLLAIAMMFPVAIQLFVGFKLPQTWLFYLTLFSAVSGALAGRAAERSRALWLRVQWSREELFSRVEAAFWKHNSLVLILLLLLLFGITRLYEMPARILSLGAPLLVLAMVISTYMGLVMTRGLRWIEATLAIVLMLSLMGTSVAVTNVTFDEHLVITFEVLFALAAVALRFAARRRWHGLDWILCRTERLQN